MVSDLFLVRSGENLFTSRERRSKSSKESPRGCDIPRLLHETILRLLAADVFKTRVILLRDRPASEELTLGTCGVWYERVDILGAIKFWQRVAGPRRTPFTQWPSRAVIPSTRSSIMWQKTRKASCLAAGNTRVAKRG